MTDRKPNQPEAGTDAHSELVQTGSRLSPIEEFSKELEKGNTTRDGEVELDTNEEEKVFVRAMRALNRGEVPYLVGAAFARHIYTGIWRKTKDLDLFFKPEDLRRAMDVLEEAGFETMVEAPHWLAKARFGDFFVDMIFGTGHGQIRVDRRWFDRTQKAEVLGVPVSIMGVEEMIAMSSSVAVRNRFDGAEVAHLIRGVKGKVEWQRVLDLLGSDRELLLWQLIFFDIVYPGHADYLPHDLMVELFEERRQRWSEPVENEKAFRGALVDPFSFSVDVEDWGYENRRNEAPLVNSEGELL